MLGHEIQGQITYEKTRYNFNKFGTVRCAVDDQTFDSLPTEESKVLCF